MALGSDRETFGRFVFCSLRKNAKPLNLSPACAKDLPKDNLKAKEFPIPSSKKFRLLRFPVWDLAASWVALRLVDPR